MFVTKRDDAATTMQRMLNTLRAVAPPPPPPPNEDDPEVQRRMFAAIEESNIATNFEQGIEHNPESFGRVIMLYVKCEINRVPVTAIIDSGAQMSIMSRACAEKCGILRLVDKRFSGIAKGVGQTKIIGKVHVTLANLGGLVAFLF